MPNPWKYAPIIASEYVIQEESAGERGHHIYGFDYSAMWDHEHYGVTQELSAGEVRTHAITRDGRCATRGPSWILVAGRFRAGRELAT